MSTSHTDSGESRQIDRTSYGLAPRITPEVIEEQIAHEHYFTAYEGVIGERFVHEKGEGPENTLPVPDQLKLLTICVLTLRNGFTVTGTAGVASPENFSKEIGQKVARQAAINQLWPILGYELRTRLSKIRNVGDSELGEALTYMTAHRLGNTEVFKPAHAETILNHFENDEGEEGGRTFRDKFVEGK